MQSIWVLMTHLIPWLLVGLCLFIPIGIMAFGSRSHTLVVEQKKVSIISKRYLFSMIPLSYQIIDNIEDIYIEQSDKNHYGTPQKHVNIWVKSNNKAVKLSGLDDKLIQGQINYKKIAQAIDNPKRQTTVLQTTQYSVPFHGVLVLILMCFFMSFGNFFSKEQFYQDISSIGAILNEDAQTISSQDFSAKAQ